ncbi:MAG: DNA/RNA non-specific endonuclease [Crocinitomicaceae bacterium]
MKPIYLLLLLILPILSWGQEKTPINQIELPETDSLETIIHHLAYSLLYSEAHEQAKWVAYQLSRNETKKLAERTDKFMADPMVSTASANLSDYKNSGFDRGHLAPAADMAWSDTVMAESFYFSNMSPQKAGFNRGIWKQLEAAVREWVIQYDSIYVVTGPILEDSLPTIGENKVAVPTHYYKAILHLTDSSAQAIAFILPHASSKAPLQDFAVTVDSLESLSGINYFYLLSDSIEYQVENVIYLNYWFNIGDTSNPPPNDLLNQCLGTTQKGNRCKRTTTDDSGYCYQHKEK